MPAIDESACICSTSVFVACCEALLGRKLQGIQRRPASAQERAENVQAVLWELSHNVLQTDLSHISGQGVVSQDPVDVHNLLEIFSALLTQETQHASTGEPLLHFSLVFLACGLHLLAHARHAKSGTSSSLACLTHDVFPSINLVT